MKTLNLCLPVALRGNYEHMSCLGTVVSERAAGSAVAAFLFGFALSLLLVRLFILSGAPHSQPLLLLLPPWLSASQEGCFPVRIVQVMLESGWESMEPLSQVLLLSGVEWLEYAE